MAYEAGLVAEDDWSERGAAKAINRLLRRKHGHRRDCCLEAFVERTASHLAVFISDG
jgi:hypothetical protein